jgi:transcriptional regulator with XRE-family HTH domain
MRVVSPGAIGQRIKEIRTASCLTQKEFAERVGVSRSAVAQWETGRAGQITANLTRIAEVLGVGVQALVGEDKHVLPVPGDECVSARHRDPPSASKSDPIGSMISSFLSKVYALLGGVTIQSR